MKKLFLAFAIALSVSIPVAHADTASQRAITEDLLQTMKVDQMLKPFYTAMRSMVEKQFTEMGAPEDLRPLLKKYTDKIVDIMEQYLSWQTLKDDMINLYAQTFTEDELKGMLAFYKSPVGQSVIDKMPALTQQGMSIAQKHMPEIQPKLMKVIEEFAKELKAEMEKRKKNAESKPEREA